MRDLCHEYQASGFSYDLKDLPGFRGMKVQLKMISNQHAFTRQYGPRDSHDHKKIVQGVTQSAKIVAARRQFESRGAASAVPTTSSPTAAAATAGSETDSNNRQRLLL